MTPSLVRSWKIPAFLCLAVVAACDEDPSSPRDDIETTPWQVDHLAAVNDAGVVVGSVLRDSTNLTTGETFAQTRVARWTQAGGLEVLPPPDDVTDVVAVDLNEAGHALAMSLEGSTHHAFLWDGDSWTELGAFRPTALDEDDNVVGYVWNAEAFMTTAVVHIAGATGFHELSGTPEINVCEVEASAMALDISSAGIVGVTFQWAEAVEWITTTDANLLFTYDDCGAAEESTAEGIDDDGNIVGWSGELGMAYVRRPGGEPEGLGALPGSPTGHWAISCAYDIAGGWVAGTANSENGWRAVRWNAELEIEDLGIGTPRDINAHGMAVGEYGSFADAVIWFPDGTRLDFATDGPEAAPRAPRSPLSIPC